MHNSLLIYVWLYMDTNALAIVVIKSAFGLLLSATCWWINIEAFLYKGFTEWTYNNPWTNINRADEKNLNVTERNPWTLGLWKEVKM